MITTKASKRLDVRCWIELALAGIAAALALTFFGPHWIEAVFGVDPDAGGGWTETAIGLSVAGALLAVFGWKRVSRNDVGCRH
jgi:hypothetical protein